jgi:hypothetical protein
LRNWDENFGHGKNAIERVGEDGGKFGGKKIDVQLKIAGSIDAIDN